MPDDTHALFADESHSFPRGCEGFLVLRTVGRRGGQQHLGGTLTWALVSLWAFPFPLWQTGYPSVLSPRAGDSLRLYHGVHCS
jgi:hypothetical protein